MSEVPLYVCPTLGAYEPSGHLRDNKFSKVAFSFASLSLLEICEDLATKQAPVICVRRICPKSIFPGETQQKPPKFPRKIGGWGGNGSCYRGTSLIRKRPFL